MIDGTVIIGHGPNLQNKKMGKFIDSFKYVIRFPYYGDWQIPGDYGVRTSYFCSSEVRFFHSFVPKAPEKGYFVWSKRNERLRKYPTLLKFILSEFGGEVVTKLINYWRLRLPDSDYRYLSTGTCGICIAARKLKKPITVLGCDSIETGEKGISLNSAAFKEHFGKIGKKVVDHPYQNERNLINVIEEEYQVSIDFR